MPKSKTPRKPRSRVILPRIPVTQALVDEFGMTMHTGVATLEHAPSADAFDAIGRCLNVVAIALREKAALAREYQPRIESGILAMTEVGQRAERLQVWKAQDGELRSIKDAVTVADQLLGRFEVFDLYRAMHVVDRLNRPAFQ